MYITNVSIVPVPVDVEDDTAVGNDEDEHVEDVPEALEVLQLVLLDLCFKLKLDCEHVLLIYFCMILAC